MGYVPRKVKFLILTSCFALIRTVQMGFHGHFLELGRCSFRKWFQMLLLCFTQKTLQSYVYSVVYMASHDPSKYRFSTPTYIALYTTLLTAYYV